MNLRVFYLTRRGISDGYNGPSLPRGAWKGQYTQFPGPNQRICITIIGYWPGDLLFFAA